MKALTLCLGLALLFFSCADQQKPQQDEVKRTLEALLAENNIPGLNFTIITEKGVIENHSVGYADTNQMLPLTEHHSMFSGSVGKTYAVALLMQLVDAGAIQLDDLFIDFFPNEEWLRKLPNIEDITVLNLLQHSSGLPRYVMKPQIWDSLQSNPDKIWTYKDRLMVIFNDEAVHAVGKGWSYSDTNYLLLGMLIEKLSGEAYYVLLKEKVLLPLDLKNTYAANTRHIAQLANGYSRLPAFFRMPGIVVSNGLYAFNPQMEWTGGGIASTTEDLARWARAYYEGQAFSDSCLEIITTISPVGRSLDTLTSCGSGSFIYHTQLGDAYGHTGFVPGYVSIFAYFPGYNMAVALQVNCDYAKEKMALIQYVERILMDGYHYN